MLAGKFIEKLDDELTTEARRHGEAPQEEKGVAQPSSAVSEEVEADENDTAFSFGAGDEQHQLFTQSPFSDQRSSARISGEFTARPVLSAGRLAGESNTR